MNELIAGFAVVIVYIVFAVVSYLIFKPNMKKKSLKRHRSKSRR